MTYTRYHYLIHINLFFCAIKWTQYKGSGKDGSPARVFEKQIFILTTAKFQSHCFVPISSFILRFCLRFLSYNYRILPTKLQLHLFYGGMMLGTKFKSEIIHKPNLLARNRSSTSTDHITVPMTHLIPWRDYLQTYRVNWYFSHCFLTICVVFLASSNGPSYKANDIGYIAVSLNV